MSGSVRAISTALSTSQRGGLLRATKATKEVKRTSSRTGGGSGAPGHEVSGTRYEMMKQILYVEEPRQLPQLSTEDVERHMTIMRAQKIFNMTASATRRAERLRKFESMKAAYEALAALDQRLFDGACQKEANATFPRQMRVPTETPPTKIWDYLTK
ncbi:hypothetical protein H4S04_002402 [Coemansia sp. S16]|nr:hypothetical protein LPJ71_010613 [Coemansia sp. S17]KAJ2014235.1 hypothetical protein GGI14_004962 [Coemansia sp. S680]KAJ2039062.1 hypothetical protein H4S03_001935 [Coemansia sp. S3946]KAJ2050768.1 hypothetical protein H4S04_002402 [Coemansia sp. S16]KAJ2070692.1 hypothetical protein GGH13_003855 [Coemansia sp. S155-1]KAJ2098265.1 hypothetical protein GGI09_003405 [Coemansia sp. S100]